MSKGFGSLQREILETVRQCGTVSSNRLAWELAEKGGHIERRPTNHPLPAGQLQRSFYGAYRRSLARLEELKAIESWSQKLQTLEELVELYPFMALDLRIKELRHRMLPHAREYLLKWGLGAKYGLGDNELYMEIYTSHQERATRGEEWLALEGRLCTLIGAVSQEARLVLIAILTRGRQLFLRIQAEVRTYSHFRYEGALGHLLDQLAKVSQEHHCGDLMLIQDLRSFYEQCFPEAAVRHVGFKSYLHTIWESSYMRSPHLTSEFKEYLLGVDRDFISSLPGHRERETEEVPSLEQGVFDPLLDKLFTRDVFRSFEFLKTPG